MRERPIIFNAESMRAILAGQKTQTRRVIKAQPRWQELTRQWLWWASKGTLLAWRGDTVHPEMLATSPYQVGMNLWVRETWNLIKPRWIDNPDDCTYEIWEEGIPDEHPDGWLLSFKAMPEDNLIDMKWRPSIFMPRWASRITLKITGVRVEQVQDISEEDAIAEGVSVNWTRNGKIMGWRTYGQSEERSISTAKASFALLWDSINGKKYPWASNPWCWVLEFERVK